MACTLIFNFFFGNSKKLIINLWLTRLGTRVVVVVVVHTFHAQSSYPQVRILTDSYKQVTSQASKQQQKNHFFPPNFLKCFFYNAQKSHSFVLSI
jgi:hypothetical protein